jgi:purine-binding chemotaxis protein CheW
MSTVAGKYLTFALADEEYGIPVLKVREIIQLMDVTAVPQVAGYVRGVINLRGKVIPVVDLRTRLGLPAQPDTARTCVVVVETAASLSGLVVDAVSDVLSIPEQDIEDVPNLGGRADVTCISGMAKVREHVKILLDLDIVLGGATAAAAQA